MGTKGRPLIYTISVSDIVDPRHDIRNYSELTVHNPEYHLAAYRITNIAHTMFSADTSIEYTVYCGMLDDTGKHVVLSSKDFRGALPDTVDAYDAVADKVNEYLAENNTQH